MWLFFWQALTIDTVIAVLAVSLANAIMAPTHMVDCVWIANKYYTQNFENNTPGVSFHPFDDFLGFFFYLPPLSLLATVATIVRSAVAVGRRPIFFNYYNIVRIVRFVDASTVLLGKE